MSAPVDLSGMTRFGAGISDSEVKARQEGEFVLFDDVVALLTASPADYTVSHTELAHRILTFFGCATSPSMEPGADPFVDRLAEKLAAWIGDLPSAAPEPSTPVTSVDSFDLQSNEQYRMQMAAICTAALGYWDANDKIDPAYDTPALRDVAKLYAKYMVASLAAAPQQHAQAALSDGQERELLRLFYSAALAYANNRDSQKKKLTDLIAHVNAILASQQPAATPSPVQREVKS